MVSLTRGYRDYRGVRVLGAWHWIDDPGLAIVTEIDRSESLAPVLFLQRAMWAVQGFVLLAVVAWIVSRLRVDRLHKQLDDLRELGQYTLLEKLGEGGMGAVYRARHALLQRPTAVKILDSEQVTPDAVARFEREVRLTARLSHPNTVAIYDYGRTPEGVFYYAMELLDGYTLGRVLEVDGAQPEGRVLDILRQVCGSLREAHELGVVHRDIKPANLMLVTHGGLADRVKVLDFGLVREIAPADPGLTQEGIVAGTPAYISPERLRNPNAIDPRGDIYALGCVAYDLLVGRCAYEGASGVEIASRALTEPTPRVSAAGVTVSDALDDLVFACMAKDPAARPPSIADLQASLDAIESPSPWTQERAVEWWRRWGEISARSPQD